MEEGHHRNGSVHAFDLSTSNAHREWHDQQRGTEEGNETHKFGRLGKVIIPYCGCHKLPGLLRLVETHVL